MLVRHDMPLAAELDALETNFGPIPPAVFVQPGTRGGLAVTEWQVQRAVISRLARMGFLCAHVPNQGQRTQRQKQNLVGDGLRPGFPDLIVLAPGRVGFLEVKTPRGTLQDNQRAWINTLHRLGHPVAVVRSQDGAAEAVRRWGWA